MTPSVTFERHGNVALVTISNPAIKNALTMDMAQQLADCCERIDRDETLGAAVIRGDAGTFCSGADTNSWRDSYADDAVSDRAYAETDQMYGSFVRVGQLRVPTVAAVRGAAVGAGLNLALATDLRIVSRDARLMAGFLRAGIHPGGGFFTILSRLTGREAAAGMGMFSDEIDGDRARELGLAWRSVPDDEVESTALELAGRVAADPLLATRVVRSFRLETSDQRLPWPVALELERGVQLWTQNRRLKRLAAAEHTEAGTS
ncbi:enoyl-CoA hydratase/isomerase family protein [Dactylosporangium sp. NPDC000244]|uniref:enoyl-CoA hydratase/isomerase family protein n=1 Tax=Dactylosporangium sp. NPDC000244 TaxID=3154365 RepID=UPI003317278B